MSTLQIAGEIAAVRDVALELAGRSRRNRDPVDATLSNYLVWVAQADGSDLTVDGAIDSLERLIQRASEVKEMLEAKEVGEPIEDEHVPYASLPIMDPHELVRRAFHLALCQQCIDERMGIGIT